MTGVKLNGDNYFAWSQTVRIVLVGRHRYGYLTGEITPPNLGDPQERLWKAEDSLIKSMLINCMEPQIDDPQLYAETSKETWEAVQELYSRRQNASRLYTLTKQIHECKQGNSSVTTYYNKLSII